MLPLGWIVPDGTNRTLEEIRDKKISNDCSPVGGKAGAVMMSLQRLEPYYGTQFFLVDLEMGEMFAYIQQQWRQAGLYCSNQPFVVNDLISKVERHGQAMWAELEAEQQIPLVDIRRSPRQFEVPPPLPETKRMMTEDRYNNEELLVTLRAIFGLVDQVRDHIDRALQQDDAHHTKRDMSFLLLPT